MTTFTTEDREWAYWHNYNMPKYNKQTEIEFFWPLTEQVPLDLDYSVCERPKVTMPSNVATSGQYVISNGATWNTTIVASNLSLDVDTTTIKMKEKPSLCRRTILKCLGLKWEIK